MPATKSYYITTPIYYVTNKPHMGHAYTTVAADVMARFKRLDGYDVKFLTGTDEHGQKVYKAAKNVGMEPKPFTDMLSENFRQIGQVMNTTADDFIRTTEQRHIKACQYLWQKLKEGGHLYLGSYSGWYAVSDEAYYNEDELRDGPNDKKIAPTGSECEWVEEPTYFFKLSEWQDRLLELYEKNPSFIQPAGRRNEVIGFVKGGLKDLSVSRTNFPWGIPVPGDEKHVMYVWLDALTNYITALGYPETGSGTPYQRYWPTALHLVGKEIVRFHAVYWPAFLMAAGLEPPRQVYAHGWWTMEGQKMSKSLGNVISHTELVEKYGVDQTRYFMLREMPFGQDGEFSHRAMLQRMNHDLANDYGNLVQRVLSMINKNCQAAVPTPGNFQAADTTLLDAARNLLVICRTELDQLNFYRALEAIWAVIAQANRYVDEQAPWALRKTDLARMQTVLYVLSETIRHIALLTQAFMPDASTRILDQLAIPADQRTFAFWGETHALKAGTSLPAPQGVFPRYVEETAPQ